VFHAELATLLDSVKLTEGVELGRGVTCETSQL
jgi:hypothetical protein